MYPVGVGCVGSPVSLVAHHFTAATLWLENQAIYAYHLPMRGSWDSRWALAQTLTHKCFGFKKVSYSKRPSHSCRDHITLPMAPPSGAAHRQHTLRRLGLEHFHRWG